MQEIADEAGVNKALLHYYFRSKDRLAEAVFQRAATRIFPAVLRVLVSDAEIEEKVHQIVTHYLDHLSSAPYLAGYVLSELNQHPERITQMVRAVAAAEAQAPSDEHRHAAPIAVPIAGAGPLHGRARAVLQKQLRAGARAGTLRAISPEQFLINLLSLCIFPFAARPMLEAVLGMDDDGFRRFIAQRRKELPGFFLRALQP
jgi:AcrR family transcriptional regulator